MQLFFAESGAVWEAYLSDCQIKKANILQSYAYTDEFTEKHIIPNARDFLLDSGAFTFMQKTQTGVDWNEYIKKYADFINRNAIKKYFELDIDSIIGYPQVQRLRDKLEELTGTKPIPVWHSSRGTKEYEELTKRYPYVAIGGLVGFGKGEYSRAYWKYFPYFIKTAHNNGAKIHALGFTSLEGIRKYHFDSVDSTAWITGNRYGFVYFFDGKTMKKKDVPKGHRISNAKAVAQHNFNEWLKFQEYARTHL